MATPAHRRPYARSPQGEAHRAAASAESNRNRVWTDEMRARKRATLRATLAVMSPEERSEKYGRWRNGLTTTHRTNISLGLQRAISEGRPPGRRPKAFRELTYNGRHYRMRKIFATSTCQLHDESCGGDIDVAMLHDRDGSSQEDYWPLCHSHHVRYDRGRL